MKSLGAHVDSPEAAAGARWPVIQPWISLVLRVGLAAVFLWSGIEKITDIPQSQIAVRGFQIVPEALVPFLGVALPVFELVVAIMLLAGLMTRLAGLAFGLVMLVFVAGIAQAWARGLSIDCGCFGGGGATGEATLTSQQQWTYTLEIARDIGLALCAAFLVIWPWSKFSADHWLKVEPPRRGEA